MSRDQSSDSIPPLRDKVSPPEIKTITLLPDSTRCGSPPPNLLDFNIEESKAKLQHKRRSSAILPPENHTEKNDISHFIAPEFSKYIKSTRSDYSQAEIIRILDNEFMAQKLILDKRLNTASDVQEKIFKYSDFLFQLHDLNVRENRKPALFAIKLNGYLTKWLKTECTRLQTNIYKIDEFSNYLKSLNLNPFPKVDVDAFFRILLPQTPQPVLSRRIDCLKHHQLPFVPFDPSTADFYSQLMNPNAKTGKIMSRLKVHISQMNPDDLDVVLRALIMNSSQLLQVRQIIFDIAWQLVYFPFSEIESVVLPNIFDLNISIFRPKFIPLEFLDIPISILNSTDWPLRKVSESLFDILIQTDPFVVADLYWDGIEETTRILGNLALDAGIRDPEIDFDALFPSLLIEFFAFGIGEVLEVLKYSSLFLGFVGGNTKRQYAMTHFKGIVAYVTKMNADDFHARFKQQSS